MTRTFRRAIAAAIAALLVADIACLATIDRTPDVAEAQLRTIEAFAAHARGLPLRHALHPRFATRAEFARLMSGGLTPQQRAAQASIEMPLDSALHALGLLRHDQRLLAEQERVRELGALGFYDPGSNAIVIRSNARKLPASVRISLAHEVTHALQAQNGLLGPPNLSENDYGRTQVWYGLVEGDATRIQLRYFRSLTASEQAQYAAVGRKNATRVAALKLDPFAYQTTIANYTLGEPMAALLAARGAGPLEAAFANIPTSDLVEVNPIALATDTVASDPPIPSPPAGSVVKQRGHFGALYWYLALASRLPPDEAIAALDGWNGDSFVLWQDAKASSTPCVRAALRGVTPALAAGLEKWRAASPVGMASVSSAADVVTVTSCEPAAPTPLAATFERAVAFLTARNALLAVAIIDGAPVATVGCLNRVYLAYLRTVRSPRRIFGGFVPAGDALRDRLRPQCDAPL
ncbi:MAG: hypothetical protein QOK28_3196 [Actinomycetota bacterium]